MNNIKYLLLLLFISISFKMISQDTLGLNKHQNELKKAAALQDSVQHTFVLKDTYKSEGSNAIHIGAFNVPRGAVRVTTGGRQLQEGIDYTVNYQAGTVQILDPSLEALNVPINITVENNASLQNPEQHTFVLKDTYKSEGSNGIHIGAFNVPRGAVRVTAGGRQLQEGIDYTVNYQAGTVQILDPSLEALNVPINIAVEK